MTDQPLLASLRHQVALMIAPDAFAHPAESRSIFAGRREEERDRALAAADGIIVLLVGDQPAIARSQMIREIRLRIASLQPDLSATREDLKPIVALGHRGCREQIIGILDALEDTPGPDPSSVGGPEGSSVSGSGDSITPSCPL